MSKILNFENFIQMNEMDSLLEAQAPVADILKTAKGTTVKAVKVTPGSDLPELVKGTVFVMMTPPDSMSPDGEIKFDRTSQSFVFTSENFDPKFKGVYMVSGSDEPKSLVKPGKIAGSAYGLHWHLASMMNGQSTPTKDDFVDTLNVLKKLKSVQSYKDIADKNKSFNEFYTSLKLNAGDPAKVIGTGTFAAIPGVNAKVISDLRDAASETLLA